MTHILIQSDARRIPLADRSVHCVVTSPPYWGLRDYGTARWEGGRSDCDHLGKPVRTQAGFNSRYFGKEFKSDKQGTETEPMGHACSKCGAHRIDSQIGLEPTPDEFVRIMVDVFREVRRVLRDHGTVWLNLGDSFSDKQLQGIPWRVAFALQADGWYLRSDIIWAKPNPMPESVTDRPTKSHEYVFLLSKSERYYFDGDAMRAPVQDSTLNRDKYTRISKGKDGPYAVQHDHETPSNPGGRNLRSVWTVPTESYRGAHFATFPRKLVEPCVKAGTSEKGCCPECGAPWIRITESERKPTRSGNCSKVWSDNPDDPHSRQAGSVIGNRDPFRHVTETKTIGWRPTCDHQHSPVPCVVLDPFVGSGTSIVVAEALKRHAIGCDLSRAYLKLAARRIDRPHAPVQRPVNPNERHPLFDRLNCENGETHASVITEAR
jgi:DNA modification methylase